MRIARWVSEGQGRGPAAAEGFLLGGGAVPFPGGLQVAEVLKAGLDVTAGLYRRCLALVVSGEITPSPLEAIQLLTPLLPTSIRDFVAFEEHVEGVSAGIEGASHVADEWYEAPTFYFANPHTVRGTKEVIEIPETRSMDFELELAAVIGGVPGSEGANLTAERAAQHIFGYTVMNDWSARDLQAREMRVRLGPCKGKDFATTLGPWIVTVDELDGYIDKDGFLAVRAEVFINGKLIGEDLVSNMGWTFGELVAYASRNSVVVPGDVLGSGTVGNGGCLGELWGLGREVSPLEPGDEVRLVIEGVGEVVNTIGERVPAPELPRARERNRMRRR